MQKAAMIYACLDYAKLKSEGEAGTRKWARKTYIIVSQGQGKTKIRIREG